MPWFSLAGRGEGDGEIWRMMGLKGIWELNHLSVEIFNKTINERLELELQGGSQMNIVVSLGRNL